MELILAKRSVTGTNPLTILPFSCVHWDSPNCHRKLFDDYLYEVEANKNCLVIGLGDCLDSFRSTDQKALRLALVNSDSWKSMDRTIRDMVEGFAKHILKIAPSFSSKCCVMLDGNHGWKFQDGTTDVQYLCQLLKTRYAESGAFIRLTLALWERSHKSLTIFAHHGLGARGGSPALSLRSMELRTEPAYVADMYILGHSHTKVAEKMTGIALSKKGSLRLLDVPVVLIRGGSFLKGYVESTENKHQEPSYVEKAMHRPTDLGWVTVKVYPENPTRQGLRTERVKYELRF